MNDWESTAEIERRSAESLRGLPAEINADQIAAWELVDTGRYMPRRIRGSFRGRELG
jgi:hypothetical protein